MNEAANSAKLALEQAKKADEERAIIEAQQELARIKQIQDEQEAEAKKVKIQNASKNIANFWKSQRAIKNWDQTLAKLAEEKKKIKDLGFKFAKKAIKKYKISEEEKKTNSEVIEKISKPKNLIFNIDVSYFYSINFVGVINEIKQTSGVRETLKNNEIYDIIVLT
jgi:hypothetical protein